jgi:uncharacterized membrane protein YfcA
MMEAVVLVMAGAAAGFLNGWIALGGMSVLVPALIHAGYSVPAAFTTAFAVTAINSLVAWGTHHRRGDIDYHVVARLAPVGAAVAFVTFSGMLRFGAANVATLLLAVFLYAMSAAMWRLRHIGPASASVPNSAWGVLGGLLSGVFGFNGNAFFIPLLRHCGVMPHRSVATVHAIGAGIATSAVAAYAWWGLGSGQVRVDLFGTGLITLGGLVFCQLGSHLKNRTAPKVLSLLLCVAYLTTGTLLLVRHA